MSKKPPKPKNSKASGVRNKGAGSLVWRDGHWWVRVSLSKDERPRFRLCAETCTCASMSEEKRAHLAQIVTASKRQAFALERAKKERAERDRVLSVEAFGELWTSGELYRRHGNVNGLKPKASAVDDERRLIRYVYPVIGPKAVPDVDEEDVERVMREADQKPRKKPWSQASKAHLYQVMHRLFDLSIRPGRLREDNPVSEYLKPGRGKQKLPVPIGAPPPSKMPGRAHWQARPLCARGVHGAAQEFPVRGRLVWRRF